MKPVETAALVEAIGKVLGLEWATSPPPSSDRSAADAGDRRQPDRPAQTPAQRGLAEAAWAMPPPAEAMLHVPIRSKMIEARHSAQPEPPQAEPPEAALAAPPGALPRRPC